MNEFVKQASWKSKTDDSEERKIVPKKWGWPKEEEKKSKLKKEKRFWKEVHCKAILRRCRKYYKDLLNNEFKYKKIRRKSESPKVFLTCIENLLQDKLPQFK